jgi:hypothetical protein
MPEDAILQIQFTYIQSYHLTIHYHIFVFVSQTVYCFLFLDTMCCVPRQNYLSYSISLLISGAYHSGSAIYGMKRLHRLKQSDRQFVPYSRDGCLRLYSVGTGRSQGSSTVQGDKLSERSI